MLLPVAFHEGRTFTEPGRNQMSKDDVTRICERAKFELLALLPARPAEPEKATVLPDWLTANQLAEYWQITNDQGKPTTSGILKWARRKSEDFPLPHGYMGDLIRFPRVEADRWAREEAERRAAGKNKTLQSKRESTTPSRIRPSLTAAVGGG